MGTTRRKTHRRRRAGALAVLGMLALLAVGMRANAAAEAAGRIERIELETDGSSTKVIVMLSRPIAFDVRVLDGDAAQKSARRLVLDFADTTLAPEAMRPIEAGNDILRRVRTGQFNAETARIVLELASDAKHTVDAFESPPHVTIALAGTGTGTTPATGASVAPANPMDATAAEAPKPPASTGVSEAPKPPVRRIPIRAPGRKPYSLDYWP